MVLYNFKPTHIWLSKTLFYPKQNLNQEYGTM